MAIFTCANPDTRGFRCHDVPSDVEIGGLTVDRRIGKRMGKTHTWGFSFLAVLRMAAVPIDHNAELHAVLQRCGIATAADRDTIINNEGFTTVADFSMLEGDTDVTEMAKRMAGRTAAGGRINLGTLVIKRLQALVFWVKDRTKRGLDVTAADFTNEEMMEAGRVKVVRKELKEATAPNVSDLGKFDPDLFESFEDGFANLCAETIGVQGEPLRYVIRAEEAPDEFTDVEQERMYQIPLEGSAYSLDNKTVYRKLKAFLIDGPGWAWIKEFDNAEDGRAAFFAWTGHYNGAGELSKRIALAKARLKTLFYKNEKSLPFETVAEKLKAIFLTLDKDPDESRSGRQQIETLLEVIKTDSVELLAAKVHISSNFPRDFNGACAYFSSEVARVHGAAQLEYKRDKKRRRISSVQTDGGRGRSGRG